MVSVRIDSDIEEVLGEVADQLEPKTAKALMRAATFAGGGIARTLNEITANPTGNLGRDFLPARFVRTTGGKISAAALSDLPYARIQDEGGVIKARDKKLAIPLTPEAKLRPPREWPKDELFFLKEKDGRNALLARKVGKKIRAEYLLRASVTIKPLNYIDKTMRRDEDEINAIAAEGVYEAVKDAGAGV